MNTGKNRVYRRYVDSSSRGGSPIHTSVPQSRTVIYSRQSGSEGHEPATADVRP
jgi:hypothetical protein